MSAKIAILHASIAFVESEPTIANLIAEVMPGAEVLHFVDSGLLTTVVQEGEISAQSEVRLVHLAEAAEAAGADIILSACSSLGPAVDAVSRSVDTPVVKIDEAMAMAAAGGGPRIGVLATVPTAPGPTTELIQWYAHALGRDVTVVERICDGAFSSLLTGDRRTHDAKVVAEAVQLAESVDTIVLAQASMARLGSRLRSATGIPVLTSPRPAIEHIAEKLALVSA